MAMIAARAGVHTTTVSLALRNHPSLPPETRQRLQALATEMGYQRDPALSALVAYRNGTRPAQSLPFLAYVTNGESRWGWKEHPALRDYYEGTHRKCAELGYQLEHFWLRDRGMSPQRMSRILYARGIAGIILAPHGTAADAPVDFDWAKFSAVRIDPVPCSQQLHLVTSDHRAILALAVQRVLAAGYRRIGFVLPQWWDAQVARAWSAGFLGEQQLFDPADRIPLLTFSAPPFPAGIASAGTPAVPREQLAAWLRLNRPEVIVSSSLFVQAPLAELGISIPHDVALVDISLDRPDGVTAGVHQNCHRVGELAAEVVAGQLQKHLSGIPAIPTATLVGGTWHDGASLPSSVDASPRTTPFVSPASVPHRSSRRKVAI